MLLLSYVANKMIEKDASTGSKTVISSNKVYQLKYDNLLEFEEPFNYFTNASVIISTTENFLDKIQETEQEINDFYNNENFVCEIFPFPLFGVQGYFCEQTKDSIKILFFGYKSK